MATFSVNDSGWDKETQMNAEAPAWGQYPAHLSGFSGVEQQQVAYQEVLPGERTRLLYTEQAVYLDGGDTPGDREHGTRLELDKLAVALST